MTNVLRVALEEGPAGKKSAAYAVDWPGLERGAKTGDAAIETLWEYVPRYERVAKLAGLDAEYDKIKSSKVVERFAGTGSTDFWGISFAFSTFDARKLSVAEVERDLHLLQACWKYFDDVRARVSQEMAKGPRGGGRDRDRIILHTLAVEQDFAKKLGVTTAHDAVITDAKSLRRYRSAFCAAIREFHADGRAARNRPLRYLIRHAAFHTMDHAWEMEDKDLTTGPTSPRNR